jgi:uncharacterized protein (TIGR01777 family)
MFAFRHQRTIDDLLLHAKYADRPRLHVAITGPSGLVGSALCALLTTGGHRVTRLVRGKPSPDEVQWLSRDGVKDLSPLEGVDAVVHLAGENIAAKRWTQRVKDKIRDSRVEATRQLSEALVALENPPKVLVSASATGFYGDRGDECVDESSESGNGFLAEVARLWEGAARPAADAGIRVVHTRFGIILSPRGGALEKLVTPTRFGAGGRLGSGNQFWSWISLDDTVAAIHHTIMNESLEGAVNVVSPDAVMNREFVITLGRVMSRPTWLPMPATALRLVLGEMANELLLSSVRVAPRRLLESGFSFRHPGLEATLRFQLGKLCK